IAARSCRATAGTASAWAWMTRRKWSPRCATPPRSTRGRRSWAGSRSASRRRATTCRTRRPSTPTRRPASIGWSRGRGPRWTPRRSSASPPRAGARSASWQREAAMKIARVEALHCDGGWRPWTFVRIETDSGLVGWGECSDNRSPYGIAGSVRDMADLLIGQDPRPVERLYWDMLRRMRQNYGGVSHKAMAGIELALWDIKAKSLGVPVYELFGGPMRDRMRLYWSHCGTTRARMGQSLGTPPLKSYDDVAALGREVVQRGFTALKTNMVIPGDPATVYFPGFASGINSTDGAPSVEILEAIDRLIGTFRQAVGPKVGLCLDLNYNFRTEGVLRIAKLLEKYDMQWVEYDNWDPDALLQIKQSTTTRLASCESLVSLRQYRPFLEKHAVDVAIIDVPWNGF